MLFIQFNFINNNKLKKKSHKINKDWFKTVNKSEE